MANFSRNLRMRLFAHTMMSIFRDVKKKESETNDEKSQRHHTPRTSDRACVRFLTESGIICRLHRTKNAMMSIFSSVTMP